MIESTSSCLYSIDFMKGDGRGGHVNESKTQWSQHCKLIESSLKILQHCCQVKGHNNYGSLSMSPSPITLEKLVNQV